MIENHRCPWCGSDFTSGKTQIYIKKNLDPLERKCTLCGKPSAIRRSIINVLLVILLFLFLVYFTNNKIITVIVVLAGLNIIYYFAYLRMPLERTEDGKWYDRVEDDSYIGVAQITWLKHKEGGLFLAKYRIPNNFIIPICFYDQHNLPLTNVICVRLEKYIKSGQRLYKIYVLRKDFLTEINKECKHFYLYNKRVHVGDGVINIMKEEF